MFPGEITWFASFFDAEQCGHVSSLAYVSVHVHMYLRASLSHVKDPSLLPRVGRTWCHIERESRYRYAMPATPHRDARMRVRARESCVARPNADLTYCSCACTRAYAHTRETYTLVYERAWESDSQNPFCCYLTRGFLKNFVHVTRLIMSKFWIFNRKFLIVKIFCSF